MGLEPKEIIQINATVIAGFLILLTISSAIPSSVGNLTFNEINNKMANMTEVQKQEYWKSLMDQLQLPLLRQDVPILISIFVVSTILGIVLSEIDRENKDRYDLVRWITIISMGIGFAMIAVLVGINSAY